MDHVESQGIARTPIQLVLFLEPSFGSVATKSWKSGTLKRCEKTEKMCQTVGSLNQRPTCNLGSKNEKDEHLRALTLAAL